MNAREQMQIRIDGVTASYPGRVWCRFVEVYGNYDYPYSMPETEAPDPGYENNVPVGKIAPPVEYVRLDLVKELK